MRKYRTKHFMIVSIFAITACISTLIIGNMYYQQKYTEPIKTYRYLTDTEETILKENISKIVRDQQDNENNTVSESKNIVDEKIDMTDTKGVPDDTFAHSAKETPNIPSTRPNSIIRLSNGIEVDLESTIITPDMISGTATIVVSEDIESHIERMESLNNPDLQPLIESLKNMAK